MICPWVYSCLRPLIVSPLLLLNLSEVPSHSYTSHDVEGGYIMHPILRHCGESNKHVKQIC